MKPAQIFHQYVWLINTLRAYRKLTLEELSQKWFDDGVADGNPLQRSSFNRHRDAILDMFDTAPMLSHTGAFLSLVILPI